MILTGDMTHPGDMTHLGDMTLPSRGYDPSLARPRLSSDSSWDRTNAGHSFSSDNWRSKNEEDGGGWRVSGQRSPDKTERWRGVYLCLLGIGVFLLLAVLCDP